MTTVNRYICDHCSKEIDDQMFYSVHENYVAADHVAGKVLHFHSRCYTLLSSARIVRAFEKLSSLEEYGL